MFSPITTAKLNDVDPQAWLADVLTCITDTWRQTLERFPVIRVRIRMN